MKTNRISHLPAAEIDAEFTRQLDANAALKSDNAQPIPKSPQDTCFRAITALSVLGASVKECQSPYEHLQHSNGSAVKLPQGVA